MNNAPSVVYPVGRCAFQGWMLVSLGFVSAALGVLFGLESHVPAHGHWRHASCIAGMFAWLMWVGWAVRSWLRSSEGTLRWAPSSGRDKNSSGSWSWLDLKGEEPLALSQVERVFDLQSRVLLRFGAEGRGPRWAWVEQSRFPSRWNDLRRALVASRD